jgi:hypothetical protein
VLVPSDGAHIGVGQLGETNQIVQGDQGSLAFSPRRPPRKRKCGQSRERTSQREEVQPAATKHTIRIHRTFR